MNLPESTKFPLWSRHFSVERPGWVLQNLLTTFAAIKSVRQWNFDMPMPVNVLEEAVEKTEKRIFSNKTYQQVIGYNYYLQFDCELNSEQLMFWRGMVTGFLASFHITGR